MYSRILLLILTLPACRRRSRKAPSDTVHSEYTHKSWPRHINNELQRPKNQLFKIIFDHFWTKFANAETKFISYFFTRDFFWWLIYLTFSLCKRDVWKNVLCKASLNWCNCWTNHDVLKEETKTHKPYLHILFFDKRWKLKPVGHNQRLIISERTNQYRQTDGGRDY